LRFIQQLPRERVEAIHADFEPVHQLCDEVGQRALRTMMPGDLDAFDAVDGNEARGLRVLPRNPSGFRHALSIAYSERFYNGRSWSRYYVSLPGSPSNTPEAMMTFQAEMKDLFIELDGSSAKSWSRPSRAPARQHLRSCTRSTWSRHHKA
jgi:hypothetical protein